MKKKNRGQYKKIVLKFSFVTTHGNLQVENLLIVVEKHLVVGFVVVFVLVQQIAAALVVPEDGRRFFFQEA